MITRQRVTLTAALVVLTLVLTPQGARAQTFGPGEQSAVQNGKASNMARRSPGLRLRAGIAGPQITQTQADVDTPSRLQGIYIDIIDVFFQNINLLIPLLPELFAGTGPVGVNELIITEIANDGTDSFVEIFNPGGLRLELDDWALCNLDECTTASEFAGRVMEPGDVLVFQLAGQFNSALANAVVSVQVGTTADDLGLYDFTGAPARDQQDTVAIVDYLQWGDFFQSFGLEEVAVSAGLWVRGSSIESSLANTSFQLDSGSLQRGGRADDYIVVPFNQNTLGSLTPPDLSPMPVEDQGSEGESATQ